MARVKNNLFEISGKLGDNVFRMINGKLFIGKAPKKRGNKMTERQSAQRKKFKLCDKISTAVRKDPVLLNLWREFADTLKCRGAIFTKIYAQIEEEDISKVNLVPESNFIFSVKNWTYLDGKFTVVINPLGNEVGIWQQKEKYLRLHAVAVFFYETEDLKERYKCLPLVSEAQPVELDEELTFELHLNAIEKQQVQEDQRCALVKALVTLDSARNEVKCGGTESPAIIDE